MTPQYLRLSVTARCNLRCSYCRGALGEDAVPDAWEPSAEEVYVLARAAAAEGVSKFRITGGEPLLRDDLEEIVRRMSGIPGVKEITLTTNAIGLGARAESLARAGLARANISLDTLLPERFIAITGEARLDEVLDGIQAAAARLREVKLNTVVMRGVNEDEIESIVRFAAERGLRARFIERYPCSAASGTTDGALSSREVKFRLQGEFGPLVPLPSSPLSIEECFAVPSLGGATVGLISSLYGPPCAACTKLRFTSEGQVLGCLFAPSGGDIRDVLARGDVSEVRRVLRETFAGKRRSGGPSSVVQRAINSIGG